eukprot:TRINITY_DN43456_c0_g1_i1.p1 TRINITY_DN43456_c0_g1~~TRINITY_DN43456_c0_g1_i1.p1  ORF type:complete len:579 (-),score=104.84 TRINITY_DN43456_c0_g1_i1:47-1783(-)
MDARERYRELLSQLSEEFETLRADRDKLALAAPTPPDHRNQTCLHVHSQLPNQIDDASQVEPLESVKSGVKPCISVVAVNPKKPLARSALAHKDALKAGLKIRAEAVWRRETAVEVETAWHTPQIENHGSFFSAQRVQESAVFDWLTLAAVCMNVVWLVALADLDLPGIVAQMPWWAQLIEHIFCVFFLSEWMVICLASREKCALLWDRWFVFNSFLLVLNIFETWVMYIVAASTSQADSDSSLSGIASLRIIRLFKVARILRVAKLMQAMPALFVIFQGLRQAVWDVLNALAVQVFIYLVFALMLRSLSDGTNMGSKYFPNVPVCMLNLFVRATLFDSIGAMVYDVADESFPCATLVVLCIFVAGLTMMNILTAILCDATIRLANSNEEEMSKELVASKIRQVLQRLDTSADGFVSKNELQEILTDDVAIDTLNQFGVDVAALVDFADVMFRSSDFEYDKKLDFEEFMAFILQLRGTAHATVKDIADLEQLLGDFAKAVHEQLFLLQSSHDACKQSDEIKSLLGVIGEQAEETYQILAQVGHCKAPDTKARPPYSAYMNLRGDLHRLRLKKHRSAWM